MKIFSITIEIVAQRTIELAADSLAEAEASAIDLFGSLEDADAHETIIVESKVIEEAAA
jgi:hypothetical protein